MREKDFRGMSGKHYITIIKMKNKKSYKDYLEYESPFDEKIEKYELNIERHKERIKKRQESGKTMIPHKVKNEVITENMMFIQSLIDIAREENDYDKVSYLHSVLHDLNKKKLNLLRGMKVTYLRWREQLEYEDLTIS